MSRQGQVPTAWFDLVSPSHPFLFRGLLDELDGFRTVTTVREKTETVELATQAGFSFDVVGRDFDSTLLRTMGVPLRTIQLAINAPAADVSLSARNAMCVLASRARGIPSIHFTDNDITAYVEGSWAEKQFRRFTTYADHTVVPAAFAQQELTKWGYDPAQIHTYDGYKEDIYLAGFEPDPTFPDELPFAEFVVVRPEALGAAYVDEPSSLVPELLEALVQEGYQVVYLPRRPADRAYAYEFSVDDVYRPPAALDGRQLAWHANAVLTGSGTMAREAACMGTPAVSFFPGPLLSVDRDMVEQEMLFHARDPDAICSYLATRPASVRGARERSREVRDEAAGIVQALIDELIEHPPSPAVANREAPPVQPGVK